MTVSGEVIAVGICFVITMAYSVAAGMWAVLWTDLVQFVIKMTAVIVLAVFAVRAVGGMDVDEGRSSRRTSAVRRRRSRCCRSRSAGGGIVAYAWMPLLTLGVFLGVQWWAAWYPGAEPGGGGYVAQRIFSARSERDGVLATLFVPGGALRAPSVAVDHHRPRDGAFSIRTASGRTHDHEAAYVQAFVDLLPTPWRGFMMAGFAAAYMSTVGDAAQLGRVVSRQRLL